MVERQPSKLHTRVRFPSPAPVLHTMTETRDTEKQFLYKLIDNANVMFLYLDLQESVLICNKKIEEVTGRSKDGIVGKHWAQALYRDNSATIQQQMFKAIIDDAVTYNRSNNYEGVLIDSRGTQRLISWSIIPILTDAKALEGILFIGHDITELRESETALKKIDETLKSIFSSIKDYALYVINLDGNITYYAMGSEMMFGWAKNELIFKHVSMLHLPDDAKSELPYMLDQVSKRGQYEVEMNMVKKSGETFPVVLTINKFLDAEGKLSGYVFIAKDITERKKMEYQIFQNEKLAAIGQLAAGMAHEINNPLFVISGRVEMILEDATLAEALRTDLQIVTTQAERIRKLVDRLLKFARKTPPKTEQIAVNDVVEGVLPLLSYHKLPSGPVEVTRELASDLPPIKGDLNQLQEVFLNLLINAHQAMPEGGKIHIRTLMTRDQWIEIRITDTGPGIAQENLKNIFMPFFTTKKEGTGLGLSICFNIIKNHGGTIDIETQVHKGTTFIIRLPVV